MLEVVIDDPEGETEKTVSVVVVKSVEVDVEVWTTVEREVESVAAMPTSAGLVVHAVGETKIEVVYVWVTGTVTKTVLRLHWAEALVARSK